MTAGQKALIWIGVACTVALAVYVPWTAGIHGYARSYSFIFSPPGDAARVDTVRVLIPMAIVALLTTALALLGPSAASLGRLFSGFRQAAVAALPWFIPFAVLGLLATVAVVANSSHPASEPIDNTIYLTPKGRAAALKDWTKEELDLWVQENKDKSAKITP